VVTVKVKVLAKEQDLLNYQTLVFKNLDNAPFGRQYIMCVCFPNWQSRVPDIEEIGYLTYKETIAGQDTWYDSSTGQFVPYNYSNLIFIKFIREQDNSKKDILL
jgi:hypothetical protein